MGFDEEKERTVKRYGDRYKCYGRPVKKCEPFLEFGVEPCKTCMRKFYKK